MTDDKLDSLIQEILSQIVGNSKDPDLANELLAQLNIAINAQYSLVYYEHFEAAIAKAREEFSKNLTPNKPTQNPNAN